MDELEITWPGSLFGRRASLVTQMIKLTFLFIAWGPAERTAYQSCFKVRVTPVLLFTQQKDYEESNTSEEYQFKHVSLLLAAR